MSALTTLSNHLLSRLQSTDLALLQPHLEHVDLPLRKQLEDRNRHIQYAYFLEDGLASVVAKGANDSSIEVGLIGFEGMTGLAVVMGEDRAPHSTFMQAAGTGHRISANALRYAMERSPELHRLFLRFAHAFFIQTTYTALSNGRSKVEERLARWLLMAHDRLKGDELPLTHEFLGLMLGVRRSGVSTALKILAERGLIHHSRRLIRVTDREGLMKAANGAYGRPELEFEKLFSVKLDLLGRRGQCLTAT
jgi:CRP-like cAMP-binding protein